MASIELRDVTGLSGDEGPPIYRHSGSIRNLAAGGCTRSGRDYNLAATEDPDIVREEQLPPPSLDVPLNRLLAFLLRFFSDKTSSTFCSCPTCWSIFQASAPSP